MALVPIVDVHCHLQDSRYARDSSLSLQSVISRCHDAGLSHIGTCSSNEQEWHQCHTWLRSNECHGPVIIPGFGLHPWCVEEWQGEVSLARLRSYLERYPRACVGEIGVCASTYAAHVPLEDQMRCFESQYRLACTLQRPVVVHWVGYVQPLMAFFTVNTSKQSTCPPSVLFHSFSGSKEVSHVGQEYLYL